MIEPDLSLQKPLEDFVDYFEKLSPRSIPLLGAISEPSLSFQDPYHNIRGVGDAEKILDRRLDVCPDGRYKVSDFTWGRRLATAYIFWSFRYKPVKKLLRRSINTQYVLEGMSEIKFSPSGKLFSCSEFWGQHKHFNVNVYEQPLV